MSLRRNTLLAVMGVALTTSTFGAIAYARQSRVEATTKDRITKEEGQRLQKAKKQRQAAAKRAQDAAKTPPIPQMAPIPSVTPTTSTLPTPATGSAIKATLPSQILNLSNWKIALPVDTPHAGTPDEIKQPELAGFNLTPYFLVNEDGSGVVFQAHAGGSTTKNSSYPRSELREMTNAGKDNAAWSNTRGSHTMTVRQSITHLPTVKPHVVAAQIHDSSDDIVMIRLEGNRLFVESDGDNIGDLDTNYILGTVYTARITAESGRIRVYYNNVLKVDIAESGSNYYFKAGCYTQSNTSKGDDASAYGQVIIYALDVNHT